MHNAKNSELHMIMEMISELADRVLEEDEQEQIPHGKVISDDNN